MLTQRISFLALLCLFLGLTLPVRAQMTDDQIMQYVQEGMMAGKGQAQIGRELLMKGVTKSQIERLRQQYGSDSNSNLN